MCDWFNRNTSDYGGAGNDISVRMFTLHQCECFTQQNCAAVKLRRFETFIFQHAHAHVTCPWGLQSESWRFRRSYRAMLSSEEEDNEIPLSKYSVSVFRSRIIYIPDATAHIL